MRDTESLTTPQLRTLALDALRVRRFWDNVGPADYILLDAWATRDLPGATADMLAICDWEDSIDAIGDSDCDIEDLAGALWLRLARQDFPQALNLAARLRGAECSRQIFRFISKGMSGSADQLSRYIAVCQANPALDAADLAGQAIVRTAEKNGVEIALAALTTLPAGAVKSTAAAQLEAWTASPPIAGESSSDFSTADATLSLLAALEAEIPDANFTGLAFPWSLARPVRDLSPESALTLALHLATELHTHKTTPRPWLGWALCMRAGEGDPDTAAALADSMPEPEQMRDEAGLVTGLGLEFHKVRFALRATAPDTEPLLRTLPPGELRSQAVAGFFARADLSKAGHWLELAVELDVASASRNPLLARMAAAGRAQEALTFAALPGEIMEAWTLRDFPAAARYVATLTDTSWSRTMAHSFGRTLPFLRPGEILPSLTPPLILRLADLDAYPAGPWWTWIVIEDTGAVRTWLTRYPDAGELSEARTAWEQITASGKPQP